MSQASKKPPRTSSHPALVAYRKQLDDVELNATAALANLDKDLNKLLEEYLDDGWPRESPSGHHG
jgi:hypothetical protein